MSILPNNVTQQDGSIHMSNISIDQQPLYVVD